MTPRLRVGTPFMIAMLEAQTPVLTGTLAALLKHSFQLMRAETSSDALHNALMLSAASANSLY